MVQETERKNVVEELHRPYRRNYARLKVIVQGIDETWQADLVDMRKYSRVNKGFTFLLTVIDIVSKYAWAIPLKNKEGLTLKKSLQDLFKRGRVPKNLQVDKGTEFYNKNVKNLLMQNNINLYSSYSNLKASIVERFNRTLKTEMWKKFTLNGNNKWINILDDLMKKYNEKIHRTIRMRPVDVNEKNEKEVLNRIRTTNYYKIEENRKPKFKIGDVVRISKEKHVFEKGYTPNWTTENFTITKVRYTTPFTYNIKDYKNELINGIFYEEELQKCKHPDTYLIERIIRKRGENLFVKWLGFNDTHNQWIHQNDL